MKNWVTEMFGTDKAAIGVVHLKAMPSDPLYDFDGGMDKVVQSAKNDVIALQNGGIDGLLFANEFSFPYQNKVSEEVISAMAYVIGMVKPIIKVPYGANVSSDPSASISLNAAVGGSFTRGQFSGCFSTNSGIVSQNVGEHLRHRANLRMNDFKMIHYVLPESGRDLGGRSIKEIVGSASATNLVDAFGIAGSNAGQKVNMEVLKEVRKVAPNQVVFATTGVTKDSIEEIFSLVNGAIIATYFKKDGIFENPVDEKRVAGFMKELKKFRKNL